MSAELEKEFQRKRQAFKLWRSRNEMLAWLVLVATAAWFGGRGLLSLYLSGF